MIIPNTKHHPNTTKTGQLPIFGYLPAFQGRTFTVANHGGKGLILIHPRNSTHSTKMENEKGVVVILSFTSNLNGLLNSHGSKVTCILFERSEFLIATCEKKKLTVCVDVCVDVWLILVLVWKNCLGFSVGYQRAPGWF